MQIREQEIIKIAKRDNNKKRSFLLVNPHQGKHLPVSPTKVFGLVKELAQQVFHENLSAQNILVIGFAETATALGAILAAAAPNPVAYIHTTRESIPGRRYLYFSEEHSHATEQKLDKEFLDACLTKKTHIIFAEDEVTTGRTIENSIQVIRQAYPGVDLDVTIASLLNGMTDEKLAALKEQTIDCHYLLKVPSYDYEAILAKYHYPDALKAPLCSSDSIPYKTHVLGQYLDPRQGVARKEYLALCEKLSQALTRQLVPPDSEKKKILILGTEEFMYPGLHWGHYLERQTTHSIYFQATTRSPILPSEEAAYPIHTRHQLISFYDSARVTYVYNLEYYDFIFVLTDTSTETGAMHSLCGALARYHCRNITEIIWR